MSNIKVKVYNTVTLSWDISVNITIRLWARKPWNRDRFSAGVIEFYLVHNIQTGSGAHPASYMVDTRRRFPLGKR
jgi:hypothetical protein